MQGEPERAGVRITAAEGSAGPVRIRLAPSAPLASADCAPRVAGVR